MSQMYDPFDPGVWSDAPGCEAFEIALGMRARGALAPSAVPVLDAHLAACDSCRDFGARVERVEAVLAARPGDAAPSWDQLHRKLTAQRDRYKKVAPLVFAGLIVPMLVLKWATDTYLGGRSISLLAIGAAIGLTALIAVGLYSASMRRSRELLEQADLVAAYRRALERRLEVHKTTRIVFPILLVGELAVWIDTLHDLIDGRHHAAYSFAKISLTFAVGIYCAAALWWSARKARRELAELR